MTKPGGTPRARRRSGFQVAASSFFCIDVVIPAESGSKVAPAVFEKHQGAMTIDINERRYKSKT